MDKAMDLNIYSLNDIIDTYNQYQSNANDEILDFISNLTGMSIDRLVEVSEERKNAADAL